MLLEGRAPHSEHVIALHARRSLLRVWLTIPLGARLEQALVDFRDSAMGDNAPGERRIARSFGYGTITLNHERNELHAASRLRRDAGPPQDRWPEVGSASWSLG